MTIKYSDRPVLNYGQPNNESWRDRFPPRSRPISEAPERSGAPVIVYEPDGKAHRALFHLGRWMRVETHRDPHTGGYRTAMTGEQVNNPVVFVVPSS
jgi:hypothetical protein